MRIKSALLNAVRRVRPKWLTSPGGRVPRADPLKYAGKLNARMNSIAASVEPDVHTWVPNKAHGRLALATSPASLSMSARSPTALVDAL